MTTNQNSPLRDAPLSEQAPVHEDRLRQSDQLRIIAGYHSDKLPKGVGDELCELADEWDEEVAQALASAPAVTAPPAVPEGWSGFSGCGVQQVRGSRKDIDTVKQWCEQAATIPALNERIRSLDAALRSAPPAGTSETLETIALWGEETFGPIKPARIAERAGEEMDELYDHPEDVEEAADVVICLARYPGIQAAIERKMAVNRKRKWRLMGDGTGYHIKEQTKEAGASDARQSEGGERA